jgi:hypothetical protein
LGNSSAILLPGISTPIVCTVNPLHINKEEEEEVLTLEDDDDNKTEESKTPPHKEEEPDKTPTTKGETDALKLPETTGDNRRGNAVEKSEEEDEDAREAPETTTTTTEETQGKDKQVVLAAILGRSHKH